MDFAIPFQVGENIHPKTHAVAYRVAREIEASALHLHLYFFITLLLFFVSFFCPWGTKGPYETVLKDYTRRGQSPDTKV